MQNSSRYYNNHPKRCGLLVLLSLLVAWVALQEPTRSNAVQASSGRSTSPPTHQVALENGTHQIASSESAQLGEVGTQGRGQPASDTSTSNDPNGPTSHRDFEDLPVENPFYTYLHNIYQAGIVTGYGCGGPNEPCIGPENLPYYRPTAYVTRAQMSKFVDLARRSPGIEINTASSVLPLTSNSDAPAGTGVYGTTVGNGIDRTINDINAGVAGYAFGPGGPDGGSIGVVVT